MSPAASLPLAIPEPAQDTPELAGFLARHGQAGAPLRALPGDASARRYYRLEGAGLLLMDDHTDPAGFAAYRAVAGHLARLGLSAPRVVAAEPERCLALIEDWGEATYTRRLTDGRDEGDLYALAIDTLAHLHRAPEGPALDRPVFDVPALIEEVRVFGDWFAAALDPALDIGAFQSRLLPLWQDALAPVAGLTETLVLRDFHVDNLMELDGRDGVRRCGLLDFQDARIGPREYDLVSLLQDARRDLAPGLEVRMLQRYLAALPPGGEGAAAVLRRYHLLGAQRHARIAGVFVRLCRRDGKAHYLAWLPRVLAQLEAALKAADLTDISDCLADALPDWRARGTALAAQPRG